MRTLLSPFAKHDMRLRVARLEKAAAKLVKEKTAEPPTVDHPQIEDGEKLVLPTNDPTKK